jgi:hypothetical protein
MADAVASQTLINGPRKLVMKFTNVSDGTGEPNVIKVDKSTLTGPNGAEPTQLVIERIEYACDGLAVVISADHTTDVVLATVSGYGRLDFKKAGGLQSSGAGGTGDILFTTKNHTAGDTYTILLYMRKKD